MPSEEMTALQRSVHETHEQLGALLTKMNDAPSSIQVTEEQRKTAAVSVGETGSGGGDPFQRRVMSLQKMDEIREGLHGKSLRELVTLFGRQAARRDTGVPLYEWLAAGGAPLGSRWEYRGGLSSKVEPDIAKALTTDGASALIRQDLEPILYEIFVKVFPFADVIPTEPANGLVHAFDQMLSYGTADWIGELDTVTDDRGVYNRAFTNIGILATRRGVSLKSQFAVLAGGAGFNPERLELTAGMRAMTATLQSTLLHGNWQDNTGTINNEIGPFDADSIDGLRKQLNTVRAVNVDPASNPETSGSIRRAIDAAILPIVDAGGSPDAIYGAAAEQITFDEQQETKERILLTSAGDQLTVGERVTKVRTIAGLLPFYGVPGGFIGKYVPTVDPGSWGHARDINVLSMDTMSRPYLGAEGPTVLEIPVGVSGQLTHLFIIFLMTGFALKIPVFNNKIRVKTD